MLLKYSKTPNLLQLWLMHCANLTKPFKHWTQELYPFSYNLFFLYSILLVVASLCWLAHTLLFRTSLNKMPLDSKWSSWCYHPDCQTGSLGLYTKYHVVYKSVISRISDETSLQYDLFGVWLQWLFSSWPSTPLPWQRTSVLLLTYSMYLWHERPRSC